jgi:prefoldin subunit 5
MAARSFGRRLGDLALALLNASLILAALCLWLAWSALRAAERVGEDLRQVSENVLPLRAEIAGLSAEIAAARDDLARLREAGAATEALEAQVAGLETELRELTETVRSLAAGADVTVEQAVEAAFASLGAQVADIVVAVRGRAAP